MFDTNTDYVIIFNKYFYAAFTVSATIIDLLFYILEFFISFYTSFLGNKITCHLFIAQKISTCTFIRKLNSPKNGTSYFRLQRLRGRQQNSTLKSEREITTTTDFDKTAETSKTTLDESEKSSSLDEKNPANISLAAVL